MSQLEPTRPVPVTYLKDGSVEGFTHLSPVDFNIRAHIEMPPRRVIPVVLVPGIMGSNLRKKGRNGSLVWRPPNSAAAGLGAAGAGVRTNARERQLNFVPEQAEVDSNGHVAVPPGLPHLNEKTLREQRGWGTVHWASYGELLCYLETQLNRVAYNGRLLNDWPQVLQVSDAKRWGAQKPAAFVALAEEEVKRLPRAMYPVYAVGYNWLQSNEQAAQHLRARILAITDDWPKPWVCNEVLVVTHSMGGLVARRCAQLPGMADKILGIVHGVMPAMGAAAAYKRMRAGFEGAAASVLGWNEAEATASMANAPGPLELLPQARYNGGQPWLEVQSRHPGRGGVYATQSLPRSDPYKEIYERDAKTCWYGLVNSELIDPAGRYNTVNGGPWKAYIDNLHAARKFHNQLHEHYHSHTIAYYGADPQQKAWGTVCWRTAELPAGSRPDLLAGTAPKSNGTGKLEVSLGQQRIDFKLDDPDVYGDGTVPADASGHAPALSAEVQQCYRMAGFDHQYSYNNPEVRLAVLHSLAKLAQRSPLVAKAPGQKLDKA